MCKQVLSVFLLSAAVVVIIILAYYVTIITGKRMNKLLEGRYTQILERTMIGIGTNITILKIERKIYIIAIQGKIIKLLDVIEENDWVFSDNKNKTRPDIQNANDGFLTGELFNRIKRAFGGGYSRNGSDNDE